MTPLTFLALVVTIDRLEGDMAVVELPDRHMVDLPHDVLPAGAREGDRILLRATALTPSEPRDPSWRSRGAAFAAVRRAEPEGPQAPTGH